MLSANIEIQCLPGITPVSMKINTIAYIAKYHGYSLLDGLSNDFTPLCVFKYV